MEITQPPLVHLEHPLATERGLRLLMLRLDLIHPFINGNKYFKLKYNLVEARKSNYDTLLTFGGAFSNHIAAVAAAGRTFGFRTIGVIRGNELHENSNKVLATAARNGMELFFTDRQSYRKKESAEFISALEEKFGRFFLVPEGGSNQLAVKGAAEIPGLINEPFDFICTACGTAGTAAGIFTALNSEQKLIGITAVNAPEYFNTQIKLLLRQDFVPENLLLRHDYHVGGYAKTSQALRKFIADFHSRYEILLDRIYNAKMAFGIFDLIAKNYFPESSTIVLLNTGGYLK